MPNFVPLNGWPQIKDLPELQGRLNRIKKIEAWKADTSYIEETGAEIEIDNCLGVPANKLTATFAPTQNLHGYDKPWAGGAGKNIYVGSPSFEGYYNRNLYQLSEETYNGHEVIYKSEAWSGAYKEFTVKAGVTYTFSAMVKCDSAQNVVVYNKAAQQLASKSIGNTWTRITATFTPSEDTVERLRVESPTATTIYLSEYQLEVGDTATSYEPYANICPITGITTATVQTTDGETTNEASMALGETVYAGSVNFNAGTGTNNGVEVVLDGSEDETWDMSSGEGWYQFYTTLLGVTASQNAICNEFEGIAISDRGTKTGLVLYGDTTYRFALTSDMGITTVAQWRTWLASNNIQLVCGKATPTTLSLTPDPLTMLRGSNTVTTNCDTITIKALTGRSF